MAGGERAFTVGYRVAQLGGALMVLGGIADVSVRRLLPHHEAALSTNGAIPDDGARLVLALLHALGGALIAVGLAVLVLLHMGRKHGERTALIAAAVAAVLAEGPNALGILASGSPIFLAPLSFMLLVVIGVTLMLAARSDPASVDRALGIAAMIGGVAYAIGGVRMLAFGAGEDRITDVLGMIWAACWVAGGLALLRLRVTGTGGFGRAVSILLIAGFAGAVQWGLHRLVDPVAANSGPFAIAPMLVVIGMVGTAVLSLRTARLPGWRSGVPLFIALVYIATIVVTVSTGAFTLSYAFTLCGLGYIVLGDAVRRAAGEPTTASISPLAAAHTVAAP